MFGLSGTELAIILVLALLLLGPAKLPELARSVGKAVRDFKRTTGDIRNSVESEFYRMDQAPLAAQPKPPELAKAEGIVSAGAQPPQPAGRLPEPYAQESEKRAPEESAEAKVRQLEPELTARPDEPKS